MRVKRIEKALLKYLLLFYGVAFALSSITGLLAKWLEYAYSSFTWLELIANMVLRYSAKFVFVCCVVLFVRYLRLQKIIPKWGSYVLHGIFVIGLTYYSIFIQTWFSNTFFGFDDPLTFAYIFPSALVGTDYNFFLYMCTVAIVYMYDYFEQKKGYEVKEATLKTQLSDSKINALQNQLRPHFLFNTLNDIVALIDENPQKAQDSIVDLSAMFRETLALKDVKLISLKQELTLLQKYVDIEKIRYDDKLKIVWHIDENVLLYKVPPLLFQPIIENALQHGYSIMNDAIEIEITIIRDEHKLHCSIKNNGERLPDQAINYGIGLSNIITRLDTLYDGNYEFEIKNREDVDGVVVQILVPF